MKTDRAGRAAALAPLLALGAGAVWSFGTVLARVADGSDAFQYLIWRSLGIIVVVEAWALFTGRPQSTIRAFTSGRRHRVPPSSAGPCSRAGMFVAIC